MAEDDRILADDIRGRTLAFFTELGISETLFTTALQASVSFALAAPADAARTPWVPMGARNIGGRIRALAQDPANPLVMYAGTALGGVFKTTDGGDTWAHLGRAQDAFPVGTLAVDPNNPNVLIVGSGEPVSLTQFSAPPNPPSINTLDFAPAGFGLLRCDQAAAPIRFVPEVGGWSNLVVAAQQLALAAGAAVLPQPAAVAGPNNIVLPAGAADRYSAIAFDPATEGRCWIASSTGLWRRENGPPVRFVREPVPAPVPPVVLNTQAAPLGAVATDVVITANPARPGTFRLFVGFTALGVFRGIHDPAAGGNVAWDPGPLAGGLPGASSPLGTTHDRIRLAACRDAPDHVYALIENGMPFSGPDQRAVLNVFHSANGGTTWTPGPVPTLANSAAAQVGDGIGATQGGQPWAHLVLAVHPSNPAIVVAGGINLAISHDFGANWVRIIHWPNFGDGDRAQHGDQHALVFDAADPRRLWVGNDGGLSMAPDVVRGNPLSDATWRKRSHGIQAAQFNDIAINPSHPFMVGGGLQDNATYISYGGETWHTVSDADGGQMAFTLNNPRTYIAPNQSNVLISTIVPGNSVTPNPGFYPLVQRRRVNADLAAPNEFFAVNLARTGFGSSFIPIIAQHRTTAGHFIVGQSGRAIVTANNGTSFNNAGIPAFGGGAVSAIAYGNATNNGATDDWWVGTNQGLLHWGNNAAPPTAWDAAPYTMPPVAANSVITSIAVHPADDNCVAVCTANANPTVAVGTPTPFQGQVFLTLDRGQNWADITGLAAVGAPPPLPGLLALPPSPIAGLVFDPQPAAGAAQVLFAGTLAGVFVIRNLPPRRVPAAAGAVPAFNPRWQTFNGTATQALPLAMVNDLAIQTIAPNGGAVAGSAESFTRQHLIAAMYGRGMFVTDLTAYPAGPLAGGGPRHRLYIRQTVVESGHSYPRPTPATLNTAPAAGAPDQYGGDPRLPLAPAPFPLPFTDQDGFDLRIDNAPFQFFETTLDGVEFDEDLRTRPLVAGERNAVYVQVHTAGWDAMPATTVHLFFAPAAGGVPPDLHGGFWGVFTQDPLPAPAVAPVAPAAPWQRAGHAVVLNRIAPNQPEVARFDWVPPASLGGGSAALLAVCTSAADALPAAPPEPMGALIRGERRVAVRVAAVQAFVPDFFIRDAVDDDGRLGGVAFGGRSPDLIVVEAAQADPATAFADLGDDRAGDRVRGNGGNNVIYVRLHNRRPVAANADARLFWALPNAPLDSAAGNAGLPFDLAKWQEIAPAAPADATNLAVPARGVAYARFAFNAAPAPTADFPNAIGFIALIRSSDALDPLPTVTGVDTPPEFWRLFTELANANNAALRALRFA